MNAAPFKEPVCRLYYWKPLTLSLFLNLNSSNLKLATFLHQYRSQPGPDPGLNWHNATYTTTVKWWYIRRWISKVPSIPEGYWWSTPSCFLSVLKVEYPFRQPRTWECWGRLQATVMLAHPQCLLTAHEQSRAEGLFIYISAVSFMDLLNEVHHTARALA